MLSQLWPRERALGVGSFGCCLITCTQSIVTVIYNTLWWRLIQNVMMVSTFKSIYKCKKWKKQHICVCICVYYELVYTIHILILNLTFKSQLQGVLWIYESMCNLDKVFACFLTFAMQKISQKKKTIARQLTHTISKFTQGPVCSKDKDIGANNHYFIGGYYFQSFLFHMLSLCNFLLWVNSKGAYITYNSKIPIITYPIVL